MMLQTWQGVQVVLTYAPLLVRAVAMAVREHTRLAELVVAVAQMVAIVVVVVEVIVREIVILLVVRGA